MPRMIQSLCRHFGAILLLDTRELVRAGSRSSNRIQAADPEQVFGRMQWREAQHKKREDRPLATRDPHNMMGLKAEAEVQDLSIELTGNSKVLLRVKANFSLSQLDAVEDGRALYKLTG